MAWRSAKNKKPPRRVSPDDVWQDRLPWFRLYRFLQVTLGAVLRGAFRVQRVNLESLPKTGALILVTNHFSNIDPALVIASAPRPLFHFAKQGVFRPRGFRHWLFLTAGGQIPVDRERGGNEAAVRAAVRALARGAAMAVYPEGHRSPDGRLRRGRTGVGRLALLTGAPCYPVAVQGTFEAWPKQRKFPRLFRRTRVIVGAPRVYPKDLRRANDPRAAQKVTDELMSDVAKLLGQSYDPATAPPPTAAH